MRVVAQRVAWARVVVGDRAVGAIGRGLLLLVGFRAGEDPAALDWMADKVVGLRIFDDEAGRMNRSLAEVDGSLLVVSQVTLYGDARKGRRPSFAAAAPPEEARALYEAFVAKLRAAGRPVATGAFGARMRVELANDGPVTILLER
jgi:D-tyrosyl-tRNA(Tyr) deacylase